MKYKKLVISILLDVFGWASYGVPILGESIDFIWAPLSAMIMFKMYNGAKGKIAGSISFVEEILLGSDFIPSFTLMWIYTYVFDTKAKIVEPD